MVATAYAEDDLAILYAVADDLAPPPSPWLEAPSEWIEEKLNEQTWSKQDVILESIVANRYTACRSAHDTGKSFIASRAAAWWLDPAVHPLGTAFVVSTAPSAAQVEAILWREIARAHNRGNLPGRILSGSVPQWKIGAEIVGYGRKPADYRQDAFQGIHAKYVLVIMDEADGIPASLFDSVDALVTNEYSRVLAIGNPDDPASKFEKVCRPGSGWNLIHISAFDTPAFTGEPVHPDLLDLLVSPTWVEERKKRWGEGSPIYISKVLGEHPEISEDTLIQPKWIREAIARDLSGEAIAHYGQYGADIARAGKDETAVYLNRGGYVRLVEHLTTRDPIDTMETAGRFIEQLRSHAAGAVPMIIDIIGPGAGVFDRLREQDQPVHAFQGSERARNPRRFVNRRSEAYWAARELFEQGLVDIDGADEDLQAQLGAIKWKVNSSGQRVVERKEDMIKRLKVSPDRADAFVYAIAERSTKMLDHILNAQREDRLNKLDSERSVAAEPLDLVSDLDKRAM